MDTENYFENNNILRIFINILDGFLDLYLYPMTIISSDHKSEIQFFKNNLPCMTMDTENYSPK